jgi:hypothetical protein
MRSLLLIKKFFYSYVRWGGDGWGMMRDSREEPFGNVALLRKRELKGHDQRRAFQLIEIILMRKETLSTIARVGSVRDSKAYI